MAVSRLFPAGTLFFTIAANIGAVGFCDFDTACPDSLVAIHPAKNKASARWLRHSLGALRRDFEGIATQSAQLNINLEKLNPFRLLVPPLKEQVAIAEALDDADSLIVSLERLIAKKREMKQGMMQELLTGRTRLPGFTEPWTLCPLGAVATGGRGAGLSKGNVSPDGHSACLLYGELFTTYDRIIKETVSRTDAVGSVRSSGREVLLPGSTTTSAKDLAIASALLQPNVLIGGDVNIIRPNTTKVDSRWLAYYLTSERKNQIAESAQGITIVHLYAKTVLEVQIEIPSMAEQDRIVGLLVDADAEITALEARLAKARDIKHGMMQELLTGRTRLVSEGRNP